MAFILWLKKLWQWSYVALWKSEPRENWTQCITPFCSAWSRFPLELRHKFTESENHRLIELFWKTIRFTNHFQSIRATPKEMSDFQQVVSALKQMKKPLLQPSLNTPSFPGYLCQPLASKAFPFKRDIASCFVVVDVCCSFFPPLDTTYRGHTHFR